ncbi:MAG: EVE domain-containing protein [Blastopirellula sp.]|nr:MAG: EVE domain-containing protein [Blastopirellula sp.]
MAKKKTTAKPSTGKRTKQFWLMKTEPSCYSIHDLANETTQTTHWDGVRNYQARNFMRDDMKIGDEVLFYHSNAKPPCVAGTAVIVKESYPDFTSWDKNDKHYDAKSSPDNPRWFMVDIQLQDIFEESLTREDVASLKACDNIELLRKGSRLSVQPVRKAEFDAIVKLAKKKGK